MRITARRSFALARAGFALIGAATVGQNIAVLVGRGDAGATADFLSSITALTNIAAAACFAVGAVIAWRTPADSPAWSAVRAVNAGLMVAMSALFFIIYGAVVIRTGSIFEAATLILHLVIPLFALIDWVAAPGTTRVPPIHAVWILAFPVLWSAYSLVRGAVNERYVYEFLNPVAAGGMPRVLLMLVLIHVVYFLVGVLMVGIGNPLRQGAARPSPSFGSP